MADTRAKLPALLVAQEGYDLVRAFARENDISISEAIRQLIQESPRMVSFARKKKISLEVLNVGTWGGQPRKGSEK